MAIIDCVRAWITIKSIEITTKQQIEHTSATGAGPQTNETKTICMNCAINSFRYYLFNRNDFSFSEDFSPGRISLFSLCLGPMIWVFDWLTRHFVIVTCRDRCFTSPINLFMNRLWVASQRMIIPYTRRSLIVCQQCCLRFLFCFLSFVAEPFRSFVKCVRRVWVKSYYDGTATAANFTPLNSAVGRNVKQSAHVWN